MSRKAVTTLAALLVFGTASTVLADANDPTDYLGSFGQRPVSMEPKGRTGAVNDERSHSRPRSTLRSRHQSPPSHRVSGSVVASRAKRSFGSN